MKITIPIIITLILILSSVSYWGVKQAKEVSRLEQIHKINQATVDRQNEAIHKLELDKQSYLKELENKKTSVITKYETIKIPTKDATCEAKLSEIEKALTVFSNK